MKADISESQVNDTLRYLSTLFDAKKYVDEQRPANPDDRVELNNIANKQVLDQAKPFVDRVLQNSKFNNVDFPLLWHPMTATELYGCLLASMPCAFSKSTVPGLQIAKE